VASAGGISGFERNSILGESGETVFIAEANDWDSIGFTSKLFLEGLKAVSFLAL